MQSILNKRHIADSGCWEYTGALNNKGYGTIKRYPEESRKRRTYSVHRYVYQHVVGGIPEGMFVLHKCDNPKCFNPDHLFTGTHQENMDDAKHKGRMAGWRGLRDVKRTDSHPMAKLTIDDAKVIRHLYFAERRNQREIAKYFGVVQQQVSRIVNGQHWALA